ncbi:GFA family protein [Agarivorans sp. MS3-6]|uniref:GFA family protein n=1 Tax=Agarivorans sp. TSD2052 TaxID=2937286 RepID=UPI00200E0D6C|nr:GFA family protein [Agarivorans sp. TSD2052]UPW16777.1 GFA family protein [Agarivorans sp. TSD2052]
MNRLKGSCLCGGVEFDVNDKFEQFHLCHCDQCKKVSGSAHVANLFIRPIHFQWIKGQSLVKQFDLPGRAISNGFCGACGSAMPYLSSTKHWVIIPAGSLDSSPSLAPQDHIFTAEQASWYHQVSQLKQFEGFPE